MDKDTTAREPGRWTLGAIRERNMQLEVYCQSEGCGWFSSFNLDQLIEGAGPDYELPDYGPGFPCEKCGGADLKFMLAFPHTGDGADRED